MVNSEIIDLRHKLHDQKILCAQLHKRIISLEALRVENISLRNRLIELERENRGLHNYSRNANYEILDLKMTIRNMAEGGER